MEIKIACELRS